MPEGNSYVVKSAAPWGLPVLGVGAILSVLLLSPIGVFGIDWKVAAGIVVIGFVLLGSLVPPHFLILSTLLAFVGVSMPIVNRGGAMTGFRWVVLIALGVGMALRSMVQGSRSRWHLIHLGLGFFLFYAAISSSYSLSSLMTLLKAVSFGYLAIAAVLYGRLESPYRCRLLEYLYWCAALVATGCILTALKILPSGPGNFAGPLR